MMRYIEHFPSFEGTREQKLLVVSCTNACTMPVCTCVYSNLNTPVTHVQKLFEAFNEGDEDKFAESVSAILYSTKG